MFSAFWNTVLVNPIFNILVALYQFTGSLGVAIIFLTVIVRAVLIPFMIPSLKSMKKQRDLQPQLDQIKKKYKHDRKKQAEAQMALFKEHGINPASGCLTQIAMIVVLFALYGVIRKFSLGLTLEELNNPIYFEFLKFSSVDQISTKFFYMDLKNPDPFYLLPFLAGLFQLFASKMTLPYAKIGEKAAEKTPDKKDDVAYNIQNQMLYTMPIMNMIIGTRLPSGMTLYLVVTTLFTIGQTYFVSGLGGLEEWVYKVKKWIKSKFYRTS